MDGSGRVERPELQVGLLDPGELVGAPIGEHSRDRSRSPRRSREHAERDELVAVVDGLELGRGLEIPQPGRPQRHERLGGGGRALVRVRLDVDVVGRVDHQDRGHARRQRRAVVPPLDAPRARPLLRGEVRARRLGVAAPVGVLDAGGHAGVFGQRSEIEELVPREVVRRVSAGEETVAPIAADLLERRGDGSSS